MQLIACGLGGAGSRIVEAMADADSSGDRSCLRATLVADTDKQTFEELNAIPTENRALYGTHDAAGTGFDGDRQQASAAAADELTELYREVDELPTAGADAILLSAGLAGASGATLLPRLAEKLNEVYEIPIYAVGVLPAASGDDGLDKQAAAGTALDSAIAATDAVVVFDNALWTKGAEDETDPAIRTELNETLATRLVSLFKSGESDANRGVAESVVDASEVINTFETGGVATLGYASQDIQRPTSSRFGFGLFMQEEDVEETTLIKAIETTVRRAVRGKLTVDIDRSSVQRGLLVTGGPPEWLNRRAIADARSWLAQETGSVEIRGGDMPTPETDEIVAIVLLTGIGNCERITELRSAARRE